MKDRTHDVAEVEALWLDEAERRADEIDRRESVLVSGDEVAPKARLLLETCRSDSRSDTVRDSTDTST